MKRKILMMSLAMMAGLPAAVFAKEADRNAARDYPSWDGVYVPHYGREGVAHPLMEHMNAQVEKPSGESLNQWRLGFEMPPENLIGAQETTKGRGGNAGVSLKLNF